MASKRRFKNAFPPPKCSLHPRSLPMMSHLHALCDATLRLTSSTLYKIDTDGQLNSLLSSHAIPHAPEKPSSESLPEFLNHVINGLCVKRVGEGCKLVAEPDLRQSHLCARVCEYLYDVHARTGCDLRAHCSAVLGAHQRVTTDRHRHYAESIAAYPQSSSWKSTVGSTIPYYYTARFWRDAPKDVLGMLGKNHGIALSGSRLEQTNTLFLHIAKGDCLHGADDFSACRSIVTQANGSRKTAAQLLLEALQQGAHDSSHASALKSILHLYEISPPPNEDVVLLRQRVSRLADNTKRALFALDLAASKRAMDDRDARLDELKKSWPHTPSAHRQRDLLHKFRAATSSDALREKVCAVCAQNVLTTLLENRAVDSLPLSLLEAPIVPNNSLSAPLPMEGHPILSRVVVDPKGVSTLSDGTVTLDVCSSCLSDLDNRILPKLALANLQWVGNIPPELQGLTSMEESLIARCRAKCTIVQLQFDDPGKDEKTYRFRPDLQKAVRGNVVTVPQQPAFLPPLLPPPIEEIIQYACVVFVGSQMPEPEWFQEYAQPLAIRPDRVRRALMWLKLHNPLYADVSLNEECLRRLPNDGRLLPFQYELVSENEQRDAVTSRYDANDALADRTDHSAQGSNVPFPSVVISGVGEHAKARELKDAAVNHLRDKRAPFLAMPHDMGFANEFDNPTLFPSLYPTLFPYGVGGFEEKTRTERVSFRSHVQALLRQADGRFRTHRSFMFTAFNILQRRSMLTAVALKTRRAWFRHIAAGLNSISAELLGRVVARSSSEAWAVDDKTDEEVRAFQLMNQVHAVTRMVDGSNSGRLAMRNEIRAQVFTHGVPALFVTINPADIFSPIVKFLAGDDFDIDHALPEQVPGRWEQTVLVAKNPPVAAKFFDLYVKAFLEHLLAYKKPSMTDFEGGFEARIGAFGVVKAYYGCVEAQGRGTLHVHFVIWIEGSLNPNELRSKLMSAHEAAFKAQFTSYVESIIQSSVPASPDPDVCVPSDEHHPCSVRGVDLSEPRNSTPAHRAKDLRNLVLSCQVHEHRATCFKYWKGLGYPKVCRFNLDEANTVPVSTVDPKSGEFTLRRLDGMVNNYNPLCLEALRNNMDVKYIASGDSAKAALYYITDYISKGQLTTQVALTALQVAVEKVEVLEEEAGGLDETVRGKKVLQKCAYQMLSSQELSAPQVAAYLMDYGDHYSSDSFRCLFWTAAEAYIEECLPSPECATPSHASRAQRSDCNASRGDAESSDSDDESSMSDLGSDDDSDVGAGDEVTLDVDSRGIVKARASQLRDYMFRGTMFSGVSLWDFTARATKLKYASQSRYGRTRADVMTAEQLWVGYDPFVAATESRPCSSFMDQHEEAESAYCVFSHPLQAYIPVPIGPALPRRDRPELWDRYCRLMLILFKPWRSVEDLREQALSWPDAFAQFKASPLCTSRIERILSNMQVFHECKDSRDEHFRQRSRILPQFGSEIVGRGEHHVDEDLAFSATAEEDDCAFTHLLQSSRRSKTSRGVQDENVLDVLSIASRCGLLQSVNMAACVPSLGNSSGADMGHFDVANTGVALEETWKHAYEQRRASHRDARRKIAPLPKRGGRQLDGQGSLNPTAPLHPVIVTPPAIASDGTLREAILADFTLNKKQALAFRIMADRARDTSKPPLRMLIGGPAGTGKTRVVNAFKRFLEQRGEAHRLTLASYMGVAARGIGGSTLHSALNLNNIDTMKIHGTVHQDLIQQWEGRDWLIVDEVSMVGLPLLQMVSRGLQLAKESEKAFGGINIVFLGDFAQLPPVGQHSMFKKLSAMHLSSTIKGQKSIHGKLLWYSIDTVVILDNPERQKGDENKPFVELLSRLRDGKCTQDDYNLLNSRILTPQNAPSFLDKESLWKAAPILVAENVMKDALNDACAIQFAIDRNVPLHWYHATDSRQGRVISDDALLDELQARNSGETKQRLGRIPLCIGMPVLVSQNFDVEGGVVNGSRGIVKAIRYRLNGKGLRCLTSVVVSIEDSSGTSMPGLDVHDMPILCDSVDLIFHKRGSRDKMTCKRRQVAVVPGFAMTAHRAQGQTMSRVIVDLESCSTPESAYVMVSRATSLEGLLVLRPFKFDVLAMGKEEQYLVESHRLCTLALKTTVRYGDAEDSAFASCELDRLQHSGASPLADDAASIRRVSRLADTGQNCFRKSAKIAGSIVEAMQDKASIAYHRRDVPIRRSRRRRKVRRES